MKTPSSDLYDLIKSMTANEKGYFKKYISSFEKGKGNSVRLFDILDKLTVYDEKVVIRKLSDSKMTNKLSTYKRNLRSLILKSLRSYWSNNNVDLEITNMLQNAQILYEKGLYNQTSKVLKSAFEMCAKYERFEYLTEVMRREEQLIHYFPEKHGQSQFDLRERITNHVSQLDNFFLMTETYLKEGVDIYLNPNKNNTKRVESLLNKPPLNNLNQESPIRIQICFYSLRGLFLWTIRNFKESIINHQKALSLMEKAEYTLVDSNYEYGRLCSNTMLLCSITKNFEVADDITTKYEAFRKKYLTINKNEPSHAFSIHTAIVTAKVVLSNFQGNHTNSINQFERYTKEQQYEKIKISIRLQEDLYFNTAVAFFGTKEWTQAIDFIDKIERLKKSQNESVTPATILKLLCHFELENFQYLDYAVQSAIRLLNKSKSGKPYYTTILKFLKKCSSAARPNDKEAFKQHRKELSKLDEQQFIALMGFDYLTWVDSKIEKISFAELMQKRVSSK